MGFGPSEPKITDDYTEFLEKILPKKFEDLKTPLALTATAWEDEEALKKFDVNRSKEIILNSGHLYPAMIALYRQVRNAYQNAVGTMHAIHLDHKQVVAKVCMQLQICISLGAQSAQTPVSTKWNPSWHLNHCSILDK